MFSNVCRNQRNKEKKALSWHAVVPGQGTRPHTALVAVEEPAVFGFELLPRPLYSPDLALSDLCVSKTEILLAWSPFSE